MKAYIRGVIISYTASEKKRLSARQIELQNKIGQVDQLHASPELSRERLLFQTEYDIMMTSQTQDLHLRSRIMSMVSVQESY